MRLTIAALGTTVLLLTSCAGDDGRVAELEGQVADVEARLAEVTDELTATSDELVDARAVSEAREAEIATLDSTVTDLESQIADLTVERDDALAALDEAEGRADDAETRATEAESARDTLLVQFDPQITAALDEFVAQADATACAAGQTAAGTGAPRPNLDRALAPLLDGLDPAILGGRDPLALIDTAAIEATLTTCYDDARRIAALVSPKSDGIWTVDLEIAPGLWRSTGTGDACYWKISPEGAPDDITDNHFGNAGGSVTLRPG